MEAINDAVLWVNGYLWGWPMIVMLLGTHVFMTFRTKVIQRKIFTSIKLSVTKDPDAVGDVSQFGALATALASTIGTGNIVGVGTAIALGGPGAVLWTWITGVFGIATKYAESYISVKYRVKTEDGMMLGGAMYALERGLNMRWLGVVFAVLASLAAFGIGCTVQSNAVAVVIKENLGISPYITGIILAILVGIVILGGVKTITRVCEALVPFMAVFYVIGCIIILFMNRDVLGQTFALIFSSAFSERAVGGGFIGSTIMIAARFGIARGLFSNESGMGSAPIVAAAAQTRNPARQALVSSTGTFWDTVIVCAMTGLVLVSSIISNPGIEAMDGNGGTLTTLAFAQIPILGPIVLIGGMITFAGSTILGWSYYGEKTTQYLFGQKSVMPYRILWTVMTFVGAVGSLTLVWNVADMLNALMAIPNLIAVILLSNVIAKETQHYVWDNNLDEFDKTEIPVVSR